jgi:D-alanyl-lipoteichoic acid acyltransferase DltB (MBOAT superfamily)
MLFNTIEFFLFFVLVFAISSLISGWRRVRIWFILAASLYFYASNNSWQILLLLATTTIDYCVCLALGKTDRETRRKQLLLVSLVSNLGMLAYFKYSNFFGENLARLAETFGIQLSWIDLNIILPIGISFYTFEALSYTIDVYRRQIPPERNWNRLAFLVSFFPHLIAGPIIRAADFFPQLERPPSLSRAEFDRGLFLIARGVFKKMIIADTLGQAADFAFSSPGQIGMFGAWAGVYAFTLQIYFDFSGYTDIAIGAGKLLGYQLPENFHRPYAAASVTDFWRRWHVSLSSWLRDYLYISLGGNRVDRHWKVYRNLMITMLLGGLWHGAAWNFVIWGGLHGILLSIERAIGIRAGVSDCGQRPWRSLLYFHVFALLWVPFRSPDTDTLVHMLGVMFSLPDMAVPPRWIIVVFAMTAITWLWQQADEKWNLSLYETRLPVPLRAAFYAVTVLAVTVMGSAETKAFIYFQF